MNTSETLGTIKPKKLENLYPAADPAALDLLHQMLKFNPKQRCTATEALAHDFFKGIRRPEMEISIEKSLESPQFLHMQDIEIDVLKRNTYEEVLWFRDNLDRAESPQVETAETQQPQTPQTKAGCGDGDLIYLLTKYESGGICFLQTF